MNRRGIDKMLDDSMEIGYNLDIDSKNYVQDGRRGWATISEQDEMILKNGLTVRPPGGLNLDANANDYDSECE